MNKPSKLRLLLGAMAFTAVLAMAACAPASDGGGNGMAGMEMGSMAAPEDSGNLKIGEASPPFTMILADGSEVSSHDLAASGRPAHLFWFATW
ncbi:MAG: hypothetical protein OXF79_15755 [Chloroflexi bacterium]|nr:hypothetical protein [Chloroflexota bacterium]